MTRRGLLGAMGSAALTPVLGLRPTAPQSEYEKSAREAVKWLLAQAIKTEHGLAWPAMAGGKEAAYDLYSGSAGVVLLLAEAATRWRSSELKKSAIRGARELEEHIRPGIPDLGLYTGLGGISWTLSRSTDLIDPFRQSRKASWLVINAQDARSKLDANDVISGLAGQGLGTLATWWFLERRIWQFLKSTGDILSKRAIPVGHGYKWLLEEGNPREMPNVSHGTAGVAFFFAKLFGLTKDYRHLVIAERGANYLMSAANESCLIFHADPDGKGRFYLGWCHGPAGTSQLFWQLHMATGEAKWKDFALKQAESLLALGVPKRRHEGYWNNEGLCCGTAGIGRFFLDTYRRTDDWRYWDAAKRCAQVIFDKAIRDEQGARWSFAEHRIRPQEETVQTGWMQGAAGIAAFLMEMDSPKTPVFKLPVDADL